MCFSKNAAQQLPQTAPLHNQVHEMPVPRANNGQTTLPVVSMLAHDLNNILANVMVYVDCAQRRVEADEIARRLLESATSALMQGKELLDEARVTASKRRCPVSPLALGPALTKTIENLSSANDPQIELQCHIDPETPLVRITRAELSQVVTNLVLNAQRAIAPKSGHICVLVDFVRLTESHARCCGGQRGGTYVRILVSDDGAGMSEFTRLRAFEAHVTSKLGQVGAGLGLTIVKDIATRRRGFVTLCSELGIGTNVTVFLPASE